jgi:hypothetical protein
MAIPIVNGVAYAWASISVVIFGVPLSGIVSIDYDKEQKKENLYGRGKYAIRRGHGNVTVKDASMEVYMDDLEEIRNAVPTREILDIGMFDITVVFEREDGTYTTHKLVGCEFTNDPFAGKQGDNKLMAKLNMVVGGINK